MPDTTQTATARQTEILDAALEVFVRYGFKKTSMDDLARAAGLSRQGLYLHFPSKETLFAAMVAHANDALRTGARDALQREDVDIEERLVGAFEAMHGSAVGSEALDELIAATVKLVGPAIRELEEVFVTDVARAIGEAGVPERWPQEGFTARILAEHLSEASAGIKHKARSPAEYRERMRIAVRLVCRGAHS
ncbi:TetR/AcrR family transcriptional regulator [Rhizobium sp. LEGMi198b]